MKFRRIIFCFTIFSLMLNHAFVQKVMAEQYEPALSAIVLFGMPLVKEIKQYKNFKALKKENLRDHMTNLELVLNMLAEATTTEISKEKKPKTLRENQKIAKQGGTIAGNTRKEIEAKTGKKIVARENAKQIRAKKNDELDK